MKRFKRCSSVIVGNSNLWNIRAFIENKKFCSTKSKAAQDIALLLLEDENILYIEFMDSFGWSIINKIIEVGSDRKIDIRIQGTKAWIEGNTFYGRDVISVINFKSIK